MRRTSSALLLSILVPGLLLVPVLTPASATPVPVAPGVVELAVSGVDPTAAAEPAGPSPALRLAGTARRTVLLTDRRATAEHALVGVTWDRTPAAGVVEVWVRSRVDGAWSDWTSVGGAADEEPDAAEAAGTRAGTAPLWVGEADGVQVRVDVLSGAAPTGVRVALVDPGESRADAQAADPSAPLSSASAAVAAPAVRTRAQWGADESIRRGSPSYASSVKAVVVHHTASANGYSASQVPALMRGFYAYHVKSRGWSDIGYNVLVDRFGTAWEGRAGGLTRPVIGAHAGGFNTATVGVSMIGTYDTVAPSAAMLATVSHLVAWRLSAAGVDPRGTVRLVSGGSTRFPSGTAVTLPTVMGHRQVSTTACPGVQGFAALPGVRERAAALRGGVPVAATGLQLVAPASAAAGTIAQLQVRGGAGGAPVEVFFTKRGEEGAQRRREGTLSWSGTYATSFIADDDYTVFAVSGDRATPRVTVTRSPALTTEPRYVAAGLTVRAPITALAGTRVPLTATGPPGAAVSLWQRAEGEPAFVRRSQGRFDAAGRFAASYVAARATDTFVRTDTAASPEVRTALGPVPNDLDVAAPDVVPAGRTVQIAVQGKPGQSVDVWFARASEPSFSRRREGVLGPDGMYRTSYVATADHTFFATSNGRSSTRRTTRTTAAPSSALSTAPRLRLDAPAAVDTGTTVRVSVTGTAGAGVELWTRRRGVPVWTRSRTGTLGPDGRWSTSYVGNDDHDLWAASEGLTSSDAAALVVPVVSPPRSAVLGARVELTGRARPGDTVVLASKRRSTGAVTSRTLGADGGGVFRASVVVDDEYQHTATAAGRTGTARSTTVLPTAAGPASAARGSTVTLSGTARPGASVQVLRRTYAPHAGILGRRARPLPVYRVVVGTTADAAGRWQASVAVTGRFDWFVRADGGASPIRGLDVG